MSPIGYVFCALVALSPLGVAWIGTMHYPLLLGPQRYEEAWLLLLFALCLAGSALTARFLRSRIEERGQKKFGHWQQMLVTLIDRTLLYSSVVIGFAALLTAIPGSWNDDIQFSRFAWVTCVCLGLLFLGGMLFGKSKNRIARFLFGFPKSRPRPKWWPWPLKWF